MSRIGKKPILIPSEVKVSIAGDSILIEGAKGKLDYRLPGKIKVELRENQLYLLRESNEKEIRAFHGLSRALISNMIEGVKEGFTKVLEIVGVGFRAQVQGKNLLLHLGFSHPISYSIPQGIVIETPKPTQIVVRGIDKQRVGEVAAQIRRFHPPEPYKGKGIRYLGEYVRKKAGKAVA